MRNILIIVILIGTVNCAKQKPKEFITGRWEVVKVNDRVNQKMDLLAAFQSDVSYFKEITFYTDSLVYIPYLNRDERLGTYHFIETGYNGESVIAQFEIKHLAFVGEKQSNRFEFFNANCFITKISRNKLILDVNCSNDVEFKNITMTLKKTGKF